MIGSCGVWSRRRIGRSGKCCGFFLILRGRLGEAGGDDLGHAEEGVVLNALGGADDDLSVVEVRADAGNGGAEELGRYDGDDDFGVGDGRGVGCDGDLRWERKAGKEEDVFFSGNDLAGFVNAMRPEGDVMATAAVKREGDGCSPCTATKDNDTAHAGLLS